MRKLPTSKATQAASLIEQAISMREWNGMLPSERFLAEELVISRTCLRQALAILTSKGVISAPERSKRRRILITSKTKKRLNQVVLLTPKPELGSNKNLLEQAAHLRGFLSKSQYQVHILSPSLTNKDSATEKTIKSLTENFPLALWVLYQCPETIQHWFSKNQLPSIILGSRFPEVSLPSLDIDYRAACRHATGLLLAKGHRKIGFIRFRSKLAGDSLAYAGMLEALNNSGHADIEAPCVFRHNFSAENLVHKLNASYTSANPPTAIICINTHHFITTMTYLVGAGIRVPQDVSLICLNSHEVFSSFWPEPTHYTTGNRLMKELTQMILNVKASGSETHILMPDLVTGKTISHCP
ncbi:DNA-binding transcriptional regulator, LacI/PurR family [Rubritalea squalenifaciens DSM 18772]|uniref:DNA-binding transcriptional regulator, LacI/PurR family n=1 Tax=Rubritalea squalenifaciens DSM 18772 TaxID=1123071 RepID=A0A1M6M139_9BACT|nr:substrate-binding domain-containing protein [Rubritalea squalenifaciens]SHJ77209.1 DNA-binding transcriptional regulator, LacI/PurR family [Rubritalea squalenifaciens DSM 18772]